MIPGLRRKPNGQSVLYGPLLELAERLDGRFLALASQWGPEDHRFPSFLSASVLERIDWFRSFPQLATFPTCLHDDEANLARFTDGQPVDAEGNVHPTDLAPIRDVLTPAACYHLYDHCAGQRFDGPRYFTTQTPVSGARWSTCRWSGSGAFPCGRSCAWARPRRPVRSSTGPSRRSTGSSPASACR